MNNWNQICAIISLFSSPMSMAYSLTSPSPESEFGLSSDSLSAGDSTSSIISQSTQNRSWWTSKWLQVIGSVLLVLNQSFHILYHKPIFLCNGNGWSIFFGTKSISLPDNGLPVIVPLQTFPLLINFVIESKPYREQGCYQHFWSEYWRLENKVHFLHWHKGS